MNLAIHERRCQDAQNLENFNEDELHNEKLHIDEYKLWKQLMNKYITKHKKIKKQVKDKHLEDEQPRAAEMHQAAGKI